jgi:hypothetical protein
VAEPGICSACGLCCDGSLFVRVDVTRAEEPAARRRGLPLVERGDAFAFAQPCAAHRGDRCAVYAERPGVCASYRCTLLRRHEAHEVERDEALARIAEARSLVAALRALLGASSGASTLALWAAVEARLAADGAPVDSLAWRRAHQALLFESMAAKTFLRRHFQPDHDGGRPPEPPAQG